MSLLNDSDDHSPTVCGKEDGTPAVFGLAVPLNFYCAGFTIIIIRLIGLVVSLSDY